MSVSQYDKMHSILADAEKDFDKFYNKGNKAAGTRVRKAMQDIKTLAQDIRNEVTNIKNS
ncbi:MAG: hypothetical protein ACFB10_12995 [Salibacteraceae bacterium]